MASTPTPRNVRPGPLCLHRSPRTGGRQDLFCGRPEGHDGNHYHVQHPDGARYRDGAWHYGPEPVRMAHPDPDRCPTGATDADECAMMRERAVAGTARSIPSCPVHPEPWTDEDTAELAEEMSKARARTGARWSDALGMAAAWRAGIAHDWRSPVSVYNVGRMPADRTRTRAHDLGIVPLPGQRPEAYAVAARDNADRWAAMLAAASR